jgi:hypothetical protein
VAGVCEGRGGRGLVSCGCFYEIFLLLLFGAKSLGFFRGWVCVCKSIS